jgi:hypothetical protein
MKFNLKKSGITLLITAFVFVSFVRSANSTDDPKKSNIPTQTLTVEAESIEVADNSVKSYILENFPILSEKTVDKLIQKRNIEYNNQDSSKADKTPFYKISYLIPENYLVDTAKILWELNIPEFRSHLFQLYQQDTIYIDTWNNVVGTIKDKTYAGNFEAFRVRNWPSWKDPEKGKEQLPPTPPGPKNPLGLFCVHFDEASLRYFHGTNKEYLLNDKNRSLSHGCVRNYNDNIRKMKEFLIKRVIKSKDLSSWLDSKRSMQYDFEKQDRFPVRIIYKTYNIFKEENGNYVELYRDIYGYKNYNGDKFNDRSLVFLTSKENLIKEYREKIGNDIPEDRLNQLIDYVMKHCEEYETYDINKILEQLR